MTCRHSPGDPNCSSSPAGAARAAHYAEELARREARNEIARLKAQLQQQTVDSKNYEIEEIARKGPHLAMKVRYPSCEKCSYEGVKVMVFLNVSEATVLRWRRIDPHFRGPTTASPTEAPSPAARFPASEEGWQDALAYLESKA